MRFEWDDANVEHIAAHDLEPRTVEAVVLAGGFITASVTGRRVVGHGVVDGRSYRVVFVVLRGDLVRVITAHRIRPKRIK